MNQDETERTLGFYAQIEDEDEVIRFMRGMACAQLDRLRRAGKLITVDDEGNLSSIPTDPDVDWNAVPPEITELVRRLF